MDEAAIDLAGFAQLLAQLNGALEVNGVRHFGVSAHHLIGIAIGESERRAIHACGNVGAGMLERMQRGAQERPTRDALKHNAVLLFDLERGLVLFDELFVLVDELQEAVERFLLATGHGRHGHVVEQLEAVQRTGLVLHVLSRLKPRLANLVGNLAHLGETILVPLLAGDFFELLDAVVKLATHIGHALGVDVVFVVVRHIDHNHRNVEHFADVFVPVHHAVANIIAAQNEIGQWHFALAVRAFAQVGVCHRNTSVRAQVVGEAQIAFSVLKHGKAATLCGNRCGLAFRIHAMQTERFGNFLREVRRNPANLLATSFCFNGALVHVVSDIRENLLRRKFLGRLFYFFGHISPFTWLQPPMEDKGATGAVPHEPNSTQCVARTSSGLLEHRAPSSSTGMKIRSSNPLKNKCAYWAN